MAMKSMMNVHDILMNAQLLLRPKLCSRAPMRITTLFETRMQ